MDFFLQRLGVHHSKFWSTDLRSARKKEKRNNCGRKEGYLWRDNHTMHLLGSPLCDATREQTNVFTGRFWQWPTCTLIASKSTDEQASQHNFEKLISSVRFVFGCCFKLLKWSVVFHFRRKERLQFFPSLGGVFPMYLFGVFLVLSSAFSGRLWISIAHTTRDFRDQAQPRAACVSYQKSLCHSF